jgi:hypothetical protein
VFLGVLDDGNAVAGNNLQEFVFGVHGGISGFYQLWRDSRVSSN